MKRLLLHSVLATLFGFSGAKADVLTLTPVADSSVDALNPTAVNPTGNLQAAMVGTVDQPATQLTFFYAQYQLPNGLTGKNIASINSVDLKLTRSPSSPALSLTYYMYAVFDGLDTASADTYSWNSGVGFDPTHTLVKFLNPNNEEIFYYSDPAKSGFIGFIDTDSSGPPQRQFDFYPVQAGFATQNLQDLFLQDTDGRITIYGKVRQNYDVTPLQTITSIEDGTRPAPTLVLDYVPRAAVPGDYNGDGIVDAADYTVGLTGGATAAQGDGDGDGNVTQADYDYWKTRFGNTMGAGSGSKGGGTVPEPSSFVLLAIGLASFAVLRKR
jgi:PEP-CTERM motif